MDTAVQKVFSTVGRIAACAAGGLFPADTAPLSCSMSVMAPEDPDLSLIAPRLWVGAAVDGVDEGTALRQARMIRDLGIQVVVDCRLGADDLDLWAAVGDVEYHRRGIEDSGHPVPRDWFTAGVELVVDRWQIRRRGVLVHCQEGVNRSPSLVFAVLLVCGLGPQQAAERIVGARPIAGVRYAGDALRWFEWFAGVGNAEFDSSANSSAKPGGQCRNHEDDERPIRRSRRR